MPGSRWGRFEMAERHAIAVTPEGHDEPIRVMALHALAYCERLFYLEEVEEIRIADAAVYAGRRLHEAWSEGEDWESWQLSSPTLGIIGKVDALKRADGQRIVYERKKGKADKKGEHARPWPTDALQVAAYTMLLEEKLGVSLDEGRIRYHASNVTVRVPVGEKAREMVRTAISRARKLRRQSDRPPVAENERLCRNCSLAPVCLPEEERVQDDGKKKPPRLFPEDIERQTLYILDHDVTVRRAGYRLEMVSRQDKRSYPITGVGSIVVHGHAQVSTQALHLCAQHETAVHWLSPGGKFVGSFQTGAGGVQRRIRQFNALTDSAFCLELARKLVTAKVDSTRRFLLRATRQKERGPFEPHLRSMASLLQDIAVVTDLDSLRGYEGMAARHWFAALPFLVGDEIDPLMVPDGRSRRPPQDRFNAALSFGYSLLYRSLLETVLRVGLESSFGFFHRPRSSAHPLVLDLMELYRLLLVEIPLLGSVNRKSWNIEADFLPTKGGIWMSEEGQRKMIGLYERRLTENTKHPVLNYSLSYRRAMELEVRLLEKEWSGSPGLFGQLRIR